MAYTSAVELQSVFGTHDRTCDFWDFGAGIPGAGGENPGTERASGHWSARFLFTLMAGVMDVPRAQDRESLGTMVRRAY